MIRTWMCGGRAGEPVSEAKPRFCGAIEAEGRRPDAGSIKLPMEFAVEANRLMEVSLEGAVG
jgi:hypothetical protein